MKVTTAAVFMIAAMSVMSLYPLLCSVSWAIKGGDIDILFRVEHSTVISSQHSDRLLLSSTASISVTAAEPGSASLSTNINIGKPLVDSL